MKVLTVAATPYFSDRGCHIRIFLEAKYLQRKGVENIICTYHLGKNVGDLEVKRISKANWYKKTSPGFAWGKIWLDLKLLRLCINEIRKNRPEIIHAHLYEGLVVGWLAKCLSGNKNIPIVLDLQGDLKSELESYNKKNIGIIKNILVWLSNLVIGLADSVVVSSENALKDKTKFIVVKDGIDMDLFKNQYQDNLNKKIKSELQQIKKWKGNGKVLIYTGGMEDGKGVEGLLREFLKIKENLGDWKLILYGDGDKKDSYIKMVSESKLEDSVLFAEENGFFALPHFLKIAEMAIDPKKSSTESSGKLMNYMAVGLPIICFDSQFNRKRLSDKGYYLKNISELKNILKNETFSKKSYDLAHEAEEIEVEKLFEIFKKLI